MLHRALVVGSRIVIFIIAEKNYSVAFDWHTRLLSKHLEMHFNKLKECRDFSHESSAPFPKDRSTDENLSKKGCHDEIVAIKLSLGNCKGLCALIEKHRKLLPPVKIIVPASIFYWNASNNRDDTMTHLLEKN